MKKLTWALIALLPFSVLAASSKWFHGHGLDQHYQYNADRFAAPVEDPMAEYRDPASAPDSVKDYDSKIEDSDPRDQLFDRGDYNTTSPDDWENSPTDRPSDWNN